MTAETHLDDATLIAVLDGEPEVPAARAHLGTCTLCAARRDLLRRRTARLEGLLAEAAPRGAPTYDADFRRRVRAGAVVVRKDAWWRSMALRRAAVVVLLAGALAAPAVRAFFAATATAVWTRVTGGAPPDRSEGTAGTEVTTEVQGPVLRVFVDGPTPVGEVTFVRTEGAGAVARLLDGSDAELVVTGDGFRLTRTGALRLEVGVPATIDDVVVLVDGIERERRPAPTDGPVVVRLGGR